MVLHQTNLARPEGVADEMAKSAWGDGWRPSLAGMETDRHHLRSCGLGRSQLIIRCFAAISLIDVNLIWQAVLFLLVFLNHRVENLDPFFKANDVIFFDVSGFQTGAVIEQNTWHPG